MQLSLIVAFGFTFPASAACLKGHPLVSDEFQGSDAVFVGTVVGVRSVPEDGFYYEGMIYLIELKEKFRGNVDFTVEVFSENSSGRFPMEQGGTYLLFVYWEHERFLVNSCGNSGAVSERPDAMETVRQLSARMYEPKSSRLHLHRLGPSPMFDFLSNGI